MEKRPESAAFMNEPFEIRNKILVPVNPGSRSKEEFPLLPANGHDDTLMFGRSGELEILDSFVHQNRSNKPPVFSCSVRH